MVIYTPTAKSEAGGEQIIVDRIHRAVADMNLMLSRSRVNVTMRLVHQQQVDYDDIAERDIFVHHARLKISGDGYLDEVFPLAQRFGADAVSLWTGSDTIGAAGVSERPLLNDDPATIDGLTSDVMIGNSANDENFVFAHELGHTLGADHEPDDSNDTARLYAYGHVYRVADTFFGDIMSRTTVITPYYSNPEVRFRGVATGVTNKADNARAMRALAPYVADNSPTVVAQTAPSAALGPVFLARRGRALRFHVYLADDTAIDVSTLSNADINVSGKSASSVPAKLIRIDNPTPGAQRTAVYEVTLPRRAASPDGFTFNVQPGEIRDTAGLAVSAGALGLPTPDFGDRAGPSYAAAYELGNFTAGSAHFADHVGGGRYFQQDFDNYYYFTLKKAAYVTGTMTGLPGRGGLRILENPHVPGGDERSPLAISTPIGNNVQRLSIKLRPGNYYLVAGAMKRFWQYTFDLTTSRRPPEPPVSTAQPSSNAAAGHLLSPAAAKYRSLNSHRFHATIARNSSEDLFKAADENQDVLTSVWL
jgi:hypothetical protein